MMRRYLVLLGLTVSTAVIQSADTQCDNPDQLTNHEVSHFFDRSYKHKMLEHFEHTYTSRNLLFFAVNDRLDPQLFGTHISENARLFIQEMQEKIAERLGGLKQTNYGDLQKVLGHISKHAAYICRLSCALDLKKRLGKSLDAPLEWIFVENTRYAIMPYEVVSAEKVHTACCTNFYKQKTYNELQSLMEAIK
jgi:hypothetical protein